MDHALFFPAGLDRRFVRGLVRIVFRRAVAGEARWVVARSIAPIEPVVARLATEEVTKFPVGRVDDINALGRDIDISSRYNAGLALSAFAHITDPVRSSYLAEGSDYAAMVRNIERDAVKLIAGH